MLCRTMAKHVAIFWGCVSLITASAVPSDVEVEVDPQGEVLPLVNDEAGDLTRMEPENDMLFKEDPSDADEADLVSVAPEEPEDDTSDPWIADGELMALDEPDHQKAIMVRKERRGNHGASLAEAILDVDEEAMEEARQDIERELNVGLHHPEGNGGITGNVQLDNAWSPYKDEPPTYMVKRGICMVTGLAKAGHWGRIAILPSACRPSKRLIFNCGDHQYITRCDVLPDGRVYYCGGGKSHGWLSLTGIRFKVHTSGTVAPTLQLWNGWRGYGGSYGTPSYSLSRGMCSVEGLVKQGNWGKIAVLPRDCWPKKRLMFMLNNHQYGSRVDVETNGVVSWQAGGKSHRWLSLTGIFFSTAAVEGQTLVTTNGWLPIQGIWGSPTYTLNNGYCMVEGVVKGNKWGLTAKLPEDCRPKKRLMFTVANHKFNSRVDVGKDGEIKWITGGHFYGWMSLSGIVFEVPDTSYKGARGPRGPSGRDGRSGARGDRGDKGDKGMKGLPGRDGIPGRNGTDGVDGEKGDQGAPGAPGLSGAAGLVGVRGEPGEQGPPGADGHPVDPIAPIDCAWSEWLDWGACSKPCGEGMQLRLRSIHVQPQNGGKQCGGTQEEERDCNLKSCSQPPAALAAGANVPGGTLSARSGARREHVMRSVASFLGVLLMVAVVA